MNTNFIFVFIFLFLVILLTMYYLKLNSHITCLLTIIVILLLYKLITQKEYFSNRKNEVIKDILEELINILESQSKSKSNSMIESNENEEEEQQETIQTTVSQEVEEG